MTLTCALSQVLNEVRGLRPRHDPGRVLVDLAVAIADGAETISLIVVLADQNALFRAPVADQARSRVRREDVGDGSAGE